MEDHQGLAARYESISGMEFFPYETPEVHEADTLSEIAERLSTKTGCNFEVQYQGYEKVIKCTNPKNAMRMLSDLQRSGFNALLTVRQTDIGAEREIRLEITVTETADNYYFPRSTVIKNALRNFEQGKIQPENAGAHMAAKNSVLKAQQAETSSNR